MSRFLPKSLLGQMLLLIGAALIVAQLVNVAALLTQQQKLSLAQNEAPAILHFVQVAGSVAQAPPPQRAAVAAAMPHRPGMVYAVGPASFVEQSGLARDRVLEQRLDAALQEAGVPRRTARAATRLERPPPPRAGAPPPLFHQDRQKIIFLNAQLADGSWVNARLPAPPFNHFLVHQLLMATLILFGLVFGAAIWIARRLAAPLRDLTVAAEGFDGAGGEPVTARGPSDVRAAIEAFNAMRLRTLGLLDEKDRMLGAIGHDLRTPLASIRIRAENMGPEEERERLVATIEEMHATLEDILVLARTGRSGEPPRPMDIAALADSVVEELRDLGRTAAFAPAERIVLAVRPNLLRRALRNLADNAILYGGGAMVRVEEDREAVRLIVEDEGTGIAPEKLGEVLEPFRRLEASRNRESGGAGLGLAIAQAVAAAHGGRLDLANRAGGGLRAVLILPRPSS